MDQLPLLKKTSPALWILLAAILLPGCDVLSSASIGSGRVISEQRPTAGFNQVLLSAPGTMQIEFGNREIVQVDAEDNLVSQIITEVKDRKLVVGLLPNVRFIPSRPIRYTVVAKELRGVELTGNGGIRIEPFETESLTVQLPGDGYINFDRVAAGKVSVILSGSGLIVIPGKTGVQEVDISDGGQFLAQDLESQTAQVTMNGSGSARIWVKEHLTVQISGSGSVSYFGDPNLSLTLSGTGGIQKLGIHR